MLGADVIEHRSSARWTFEQIFFPNLVYEFNVGFVDYINNDNEEVLKGLMLWAWSYFATLYLESEMDISMDILADNQEQLSALGFGREHIVGVTIERISDEVAAAIIEMLNIDEPRRSTFMAIVYTDDSNLRLFTLEQSYGPDNYMFCFVGRDSRGSFFPIGNSKDEFIEAILEVIEDQIDPSAGIVWQY